MIHTIELILENVMPFEFFKNFYEDLKKCNSCCHKATYKGIELKYYIPSRVLVLVVNVLDIMHKDMVCVSDLAEFKRRIEQIAYELIKRKNIELKVNRIDYFVDLYFEKNELDIVKMDLLKKFLHKYKYMSVKHIYSTSLAVRTRYGMRNLNLYQKERERLEKGDLEGAKKYKGIFRIELQLKKRAIKNSLIQNGISQDIENFWSKSAFIENFIEIFKNYLYTGTFYRVDKAREIISNSDFKDIIKTRLCIFITQVNKVGMNKIKKFYAPATIKKYIKKLSSIDVNPICFNENKNIECIESMMKRCIEIAKKDYFK